MIGFFKRLRDGLLDPKAVVNYLSDKIFYPLFTLLFFVIVAMIPNMIRVYNYTVPYSVRSTIQEAVVGRELNYKIQNGKLIKGDNEEDIAFASEGIGYAFFDAKVSGTTSFTIRLKEDGLYLDQSVMGVLNTQNRVLDYTRYDELKNFDISKLKDSSSEEWEIVFKVFNTYYKDNRAGYMITEFIQGFTSRLLAFILFDCIFALSIYLTIGRRLKYFALMKVVIYYLVPYFLTSLLASSINISFISFVGIVVSIVFVNIGKIELIKKIYRSHTEE
ncbi:MAG: hypothetical protein IJS58_02880 [Bacilli bacterium]|nr:hypothetical protein [Bacilli bacterium]